MMQVGGSGGRESDFRHQHDGSLAGGKHSFHRRKIDGSLSRAGDAVEKGDRKFLCTRRSVDLRQRFALLGGELDVVYGARCEAGKLEAGGRFNYLDETSLDQ